MSQPGPRRSRHSRWSRYPSSFRSGEKPPGAGEDLQRITLYLPSALLDRAEAQAHSTGAPSVQAYCESLLREAITLVEAPAEPSNPLVTPAAEDLVGDIAWDPASLVEWSSVAQPRRDPDGSDIEVMAISELPDPGASTLGAARVESPRAVAGDAAGLPDPSEPETVAIDEAVLLVLRHAALAEEIPDGLIPCLRRGDPIPPGPADDLLNALIELEHAYRDANVIDRRLAFALHRLAFEGQVLLTDAWPGASPEPATVETLRLVQEAVDRILSGEDIRYYREEVEETDPDTDD